MTVTSPKLCDCCGCVATAGDTYWLIRPLRTDGSVPLFPNRHWRLCVDCCPLDLVPAPALPPQEDPPQ